MGAGSEAFRLFGNSAEFKKISENVFSKVAKKGDEEQFDGVNFGPGGSRYMSYPIARSNQEKTGDTLRIACVEFIAPKDGGLTSGIQVEDATFVNNFADGKTTVINNDANRKAALAMAKEKGISIDLPGLPKLTAELTDANTRMSNSQAKRTKYYIELPMPQEVNDQYSVTWGDDRVNALEVAALSVAQKAMKRDGLAEARNAVASLMGNVNIPELNEGTQDAVRAAISGAAVGSLGSQVSASSVVARSTGQILNSNLELLFQGMNLRSFPYSITFSPRSQEEGRVVKAIIRSLKQSMAPRAGEYNGNSAQGIFLKSPDVFQLTYLRDGNPHPFLNRMKLTALTGLNINYTNSGTYSSYEDGTPVNIRMDMTFKELNPIYSEDYKSTELGGVGY